MRNIGRLRKCLEKQWDVKIKEADKGWDQVPSGKKAAEIKRKKRIGSCM